MKHKFPPHLAHLSHALSQRDFYMREHFRHISNLFNPKVKLCWQVSSSRSGQREAAFWGRQSRTEVGPCEPGAQPCRKASLLCPAAHQRLFTGNARQSIPMLKSRLEFQFQVNSKFTSEGIFSQVAVSLFILLSCSQVNSSPRIIKPSVGLRVCRTKGRALEETPEPHHGCRSPCFPSVSYPCTIQSPKSAALPQAWALPAQNSCAPGLPALLWQGGNAWEASLHVSIPIVTQNL